MIDRDNPTIADVLTAHAEALRSELHTAMPARVKSYDARRQTVDVTPSLGRYIPSEDGGYERETLPDLFAVPVCFPRSGAYGLTFPISEGDTVLLVFSQFPTHQWQSGGNESESGDLRTHDFGSAIAIPGLYPDSKATPHAGDALVVYGDKVAIGSHDASHPIALGDNVKRFCDAVMQFLQTHTHGTPSGPSTTANPPPAFSVPQIESTKHKIDG